MKIIFLCGCIEPGKTGLGDYTRKFAAELNRKGNNVFVIALADPYVSLCTETQQEEWGTQVAMLRMSTKVNWNNRTKTASVFIKKFNPDLISLQYCPFTFHLKYGLPLKLNLFIWKLSKNYDWHIMFHEIWVNKKHGHRDTLKIKILSIIQQLLIKNLLFILNKSLKHTHLPMWQTTLNKLGYTIKPLPLFSNIRNTARENNTNKDIIRVAFFSQVVFTPDVLNFLKTLKISVKASNKKLEILLLGGDKNRMKLFEEYLSHLIDENTCIINIGFLSEQDLSNLISSCSIGIASQPKNILGKSGSVAAFLEHGVPVASPVSSTISNSFFNQNLIDAIIDVPDIDLIDNASKQINLNKRSIDLSVIVNQFLVDTTALTYNPTHLIDSTIGK